MDESTAPIMVSDNTKLLILINNILISELKHIIEWIMTEL